MTARAALQFAEVRSGALLQRPLETGGAGRGTQQPRCPRPEGGSCLCSETKPRTPPPISHGADLAVSVKTAQSNLGEPGCGRAVGGETGARGEDRREQGPAVLPNPGAGAGLGRGFLGRVGVLLRVSREQTPETETHVPAVRTRGGAPAGRPELSYLCGSRPRPGYFGTDGRRHSCPVSAELSWASPRLWAPGPPGLSAARLAPC